MRAIAHILTCLSGGWVCVHTFHLHEWQMHMSTSHTKWADHTCLLLMWKNSLFPPPALKAGKVGELWHRVQIMGSIYFCGLSWSITFSFTHPSLKKTLTTLDRFRLQKRSMTGDIIAVFKYSIWQCCHIEEDSDLFSCVPEGKTNRMKFQGCKYRLDMKNCNLLTARAVNQWHAVWNDFCPFIGGFQIQPNRLHLLVMVWKILEGQDLMIS